MIQWYRRYLHRKLHRILKELYPTSIAKQGFHSGELAKSMEIEMFNQGKILGVVQIINYEDEEGYSLSAYTKEEVLSDDD